jgi:hypothetical protein
MHTSREMLDFIMTCHTKVFWVIHFETGVGSSLGE